MARPFDPAIFDSEVFDVDAVVVPVAISPGGDLRGALRRIRIQDRPRLRLPIRQPVPIVITFPDEEAVAIASYAAGTINEEELAALLAA